MLQNSTNFFSLFNWKILLSDPFLITMILFIQLNFFFPPWARILTIKRGMKRASLSVMSRIFATPWTVAYQGPLSLGFSRQECWSGLPCPPPGDLPDPEIKLTSLKSPALQEDSLPLSYPRSPQRGIGLLNCYKTMWKMSEDAGFREVATNAKSVNFLIWTIK